MYMLSSLREANTCSIDASIHLAFCLRINGKLVRARANKKWPSANTATFEVSEAVQQGRGTTDTH